MQYRVVRPQSESAASILHVVLDSLKAYSEMRSGLARPSRVCCQSEQFVSLKEGFPAV